MHPFYQLLMAHQVALGIALLWIFSGFVSAMEPPTTQSGPVYKTIYHFLNIMAGDLSLLFGKYMPKASSAGTAAVVALLCLTLVLAPVTGCSQQSGTKVAQDIVNWTPALLTAVNTVDATASLLLPAYGPVFTSVTTGFDAAAALVQQYAKAYLANPSASVLANLQTAIVTLQQNVSASLLAAAHIVDPASQKLAMAAINGLATVINTILALVQTISSKTQLAAMEQQVRVHLAEVRPYMDIPALNAAGAPYGVTADRFFAAEAQAGF